VRHVFAHQGQHHITANLLRYHIMATTSLLPALLSLLCLLTLLPLATAQCYTATRILPPTTCPPPTKGGTNTDPKGSPKGKGCAFKCPLPSFSTVTMPPAVAACSETATVTMYETACSEACPSDEAGCPKSLVVTVTATARQSVATAKEEWVGGREGFE
jgi:hypothetical protein